MVSRRAGHRLVRWKIPKLLHAMVKDKATANMMQAGSRLRAIPAPVTAMMLISPILAYLSGSLFFQLHADAGKVLRFNP